MLDGVIGAGRSIVRVTAELDFQQVEKTSEMFDPNSAVVRSEQKTDENRTNTEKQEELAESSNEDRSETSITNYEINKTVEHIINAVGNMSRLSVAVLLDGNYKETESEEGAMGIVYEPRPQEEIDRISAIVKNAVGFDSERSDQIEVLNMPFDRTSMEYEQDKLDQIYQQEFFYDIGKKVLLVLFAVAAFLYLRKKAKKLFASLGRILPPARPSSSTPATAYTALGEEEEENAPEVTPEKRKPKLVDRMQETAKERPDEIAKVIRTMMFD
jgi:flagellar M-ring protein FliF